MLMNFWIRISVIILLFFLFMSCGQDPDINKDRINSLINAVKYDNEAVLSDIAQNSEIYEELKKINFYSMELGRVQLSGISDSTKIYSFTASSIIKKVIILNIEYLMHLKDGKITAFSIIPSYSLARNMNTILPEDIMLIFTKDFDSRFFYDEQYLSFLDTLYSKFVYSRDRMIRKKILKILAYFHNMYIRDYSLFYSSSTSCRSTVHINNSEYTVIFEKKGPQWQITNISDKSQ